MKVGDYVRTNDGNIFQITGSDIEFASEIGSDGNLPFNAKIISSEIIDLIEVGDYVNGYKVTYVASEEPCPSGKFVDIDCDKDSSDSYFFDNEIKTIVTHEQFESMEYKLG